MAERAVVRIPSLIGGVSSQADHLLFPGQVRRANNVNCIAASGVSKRPGSSLVAVVSGPTAGADLKMHPIFRDDTEKYAVIYGIQGGSIILKVYAKDGTAAVVNIDADALIYLQDSGTVTDDLDMLTIADTTLIWNRHRTPGTYAQGGSYTITGTYKNFNVLTSIIGVPDAYYRTTADNVSPAFDAGYHQYMVASADNGWANWVGANAADGYRNAGGKYDEYTTVGFRIRFRRKALSATGVAYTHGSLNLAITGHGFTFAPNYHVYVSTGGAGIPAGYYPITAVPDANNLTISASGVSASGGSITATADTTGLVIDGIHTGLGEVNADCNPRKEDMYEVAETIEAQLQACGLPDVGNAMVNWQQVSSSTGKFQIVAPYRGTGAKVQQIIAPTTAGCHDLSASGRPFEFAASGAVNTVGTGSMTFGTTDTQTIVSRWESVPAPGDTSAELNPNSMPVKMTRTSLSPLTFTVDIIDWNPRVSGDSVTNPGPSFVKDGLPVQDIAFFKNRLWFAAGQYIFCSQAGDFYNLWNQGTTIVDSDPFEIELGDAEVAQVQYLIPWKNKLVAFSKAGRQYESNEPQVVNAEQFQFRAGTTYRTIACRPRTMDHRLYIVTTGDDDNVGGEHCAVREWQYDYQIDTSDAINISEHCFKFLPGAFRSIWSMPNVGVLVGVQQDSPVLYIYRTLFNGSKVIQRAWTSWSFDDQYSISDGCIIDTNFWFIVEDSNQFTLERIRLERGEAGVNGDLGGDGGSDGGGGGDDGGGGDGEGGGGSGGDSFGGGGAIDADDDNGTDFGGGWYVPDTGA